MLACVLAARIPKQEVAALYLRWAYFGWRMNGFAVACRRLGLDESSMALRDAANVVARLKYPEPKNPSFARKSLLARRTDHILRLVSHETEMAEISVNSTVEVVDAD